MSKTEELRQEARRCSRCCLEKPRNAEHFTWSQKRHKWSSWCRECLKEHQRATYAPEERKARRNRHAERWDHLRRRYGMSREDYEELLAKQEGLCALCGERPPAVVDHDHACCDTYPTCGECTRGLLCHRCNIFMGGWDAGLAAGVEEYLEN